MFSCTSTPRLCLAVSCFLSNIFACLPQPKKGTVRGCLETLSMKPQQKQETKKKSHHGKKSERAAQFKAVKKFIRENSFRDVEKDETMNINKTEEIYDHLCTKFSGVHRDISSNYWLGEVVLDSSSTGSFQIDAVQQFLYHNYQAVNNYRYRSGWG